MPYSEASVTGSVTEACCAKTFLGGALVHLEVRGRHGRSGIHFRISWPVKKRSAGLWARCARNVRLKQNKA
jgi:hypothetical protein